MVEPSMLEPDLFYFGITRLSHMMCLSHTKVIHIVKSPFLSTMPNNFLHENILDKTKIKVHQCCTI